MIHTRLARLAPLALLLAAACHREAAGPLRVDRAWVRLPAVAGQPGAAYFTLHGGPADDRLLCIESALVGRIELHETMQSGPTMTMPPLAEVKVDAGATSRFAPGDRHAMLYAIDPNVKPGTAIPLRFGFASGKTLEAEAKTVAAGGDAPY